MSGNDNEDNTGGLPGFVANSAIKLRADGRAPAVQPTRLIQQPIFHNSRRAARYSIASRSYTMRDEGVEVVYIAETANPFPRPPDGERVRESPHGLLRYSDLDVLMALSYHFTRYGRPLIEIDQRTILSWMGYEQFDEAPYRELRASLQRMASTTISVNIRGATVQDYVPSRLVDLHDRSQAEQTSRTTIRASLSESWRQNIGRGFTLVDMHAYAHLCRVDRECGLARVLYLFFCSVKDHNSGAFNIPLNWVSERWRDLTGKNQIPVYADPLDRKSALHEALKLLHESGVMAIDEARVDDRGRATMERRLAGSFAPAANVPRIPEEAGPRQVSLFSTNRLTGQPTPVPEAPTKPPVDEAPSTSSSMTRADVLRSEQALFTDACIASLATDIGLSQRIVKRAIASTWTDRHLVARMLVNIAFRSRHGDIEKPAAYAAKILIDGSPDDEMWKSSEERTREQDWAISKDGPLFRLMPMYERLRELKRDVKKLPAPERQPSVSTIQHEHEEATAPSELVEAVRKILAEIGVIANEDRIKILSSIGKEILMRRTAEVMREEWLAADSKLEAQEEASNENDDDELISEIARELSENKAMAAKLGYSVGTSQARFMCAMDLAKSKPKLAKWRSAISTS